MYKVILGNAQNTWRFALLKMRGVLVIVTSALSKRFGHTAAVDGVSLRIEEGEVFAWLGHNGAGKTTMVRLLNGILTPTAGSASVMGLSPIEDGPRLRRHTGVLTETPSLDGRMTAREMMVFYARIYGIDHKAARSRADELLEQMGLSERAADRIAGFSRGMRQRLAIARALLHDPKILFLDEPTAGLDPVAALDIRNLIADFPASGQKTVILCTHDLAEAEQLCNRVAILEQGAVLEVGTPSELIDRHVSGIHVRITVADDQVKPARKLLGTSCFEITRGTSTTAQATLEHSVASRDDIPGLLQRLVEAGILVFEIFTVRPTLEDVYLGFHGRTREQVSPNGGRP